MLQRRRPEVTRIRARRWVLRALAAGGLAAAALTLGSGSASAADDARTQVLGDVVGGLLGPVGDNLVDPLVDDVVSPLVGGVVAPVVEDVVAPVTTPVVENVVSPAVGTVAPVVRPVVEDVVAPVVEPVRKVMAPVTDPLVRDVVTPVVQPVVDVVAPVTKPVEDAVAPVMTPIEDALAPVTDPVKDVVAPIVSPAPREDAPPQGTVPTPPGEPQPGTEPGAPAPGEPSPAPVDETGAIPQPGPADPAQTTTPVGSVIQDEARDALAGATRDLGLVADSARTELTRSLASTADELADGLALAGEAASEATVTAYDQVAQPTWVPGNADREPAGPVLSSAPAPASSFAQSSGRALTSDVGALAGILLPALCVVWLTVGRERLRLLERSLEVPTSPA